MNIIFFEKPVMIEIRNQYILERSSLPIADLAP